MEMNNEPYKATMTGFTYANLLERLYAETVRIKEWQDIARKEGSEDRYQACSQQRLGIILAIGFALAERSGRETENNGQALMRGNQWVHWRRTGESVGVEL